MDPTSHYYLIFCDCKFSEVIALVEEAWECLITNFYSFFLGCDCIFSSEHNDSPIGAVQQLYA